MFKFGSIFGADATLAVGRPTSCACHTVNGKSNLLGFLLHNVGQGAPLISAVNSQFVGTYLKNFRSCHFFTQKALSSAARLPHEESPLGAGRRAWSVNQSVFQSVRLRTLQTIPLATPCVVRIGDVIPFSCSFHAQTLAGTHSAMHEKSLLDFLVRLLGSGAPAL